MSIVARFVVRVLGVIVLVMSGVAAPPIDTAARAASDAGPVTTMALEASYRLVATLRYQPPRIVVVETIDLCNRSAETIEAVHLSVLGRAYGETRIRWVRVGAIRPVVSYPNAADLLVRLPWPLGVGAWLRLDIGFVDVPSADISDQLHARLSKAEGMLRASDWFPILSDGHGLRNPGDSQFTAAADSITLDLRTMRDLDIAAPGKVVLSEPLHHVYRLEHARNYGFVVAPHLTHTTTVTDDGVLVSVYCPPGVDGSVTLATARAALEVYTDAYGPYPWPELILAPTPRRLIADEWPAMVFLGTRRYTHRLTIRHEIAHQWFYATLGDDQLREPWLDEAFADFSARHFFHHRIGRRTCSRYPVDSSVMTFPDSPLRWGCDSYTETVYLKGTVMIEGVRARLGDAIFFAGLRRLLAEHRFGVVTTVEVLQTWIGASRDRASMLAYLGRFFSPPSMCALAGPTGVCPCREPTPPTHGSCAVRLARCPF